MGRKPEPLIVPGHHAVRESLTIEGRVVEVWVSEDLRSRRAREVVAQAEERGVPVRRCRAADLDARLPDTSHQGLAAVVRAPGYVPLEDLAETCRRGGEPALLIAADHITDEGNLGALIRTAAFFGARGLVLPRDRSAGLSERVAKRSAGASLFFPVARAVNLVRALKHLDREGFWIIGAAGEARVTVYTFDWDRDTVLVMGSEDRGLAPTVRAQCHELVAVPGSGRVESLNVAVAAGAILSEIHRQRRVKGGRR